MRNKICLAAMLVLASTACTEADAPYVGTWKMDLEQSDMKQLTLQYTMVDSMTFTVAMDGQSYTLKVDGTESATPWGTTAAWTVIDATSWQAVNHVNGQLASTDTIRLSADGATLTVDSRVMKATGESSMDQMTFRRAAGGPGLAGTWQAETMSSSAPNSLVIARGEDNHVLLTFVDQQGTCNAPLDGTDAAAAGKMFPEGWMCALTPSGTHGLDLTWKKDGNVMYRSTLMASDDGTTLTDSGGAAATSERTTVVYKRQ